MADEPKKAPDYDSEKVEQLLTILDLIKELYPSIRQASQMKLSEIDLELWEELYPEEAKAKKEKEEEIKKAEEERIKKAKEDEQKALDERPATPKPATYERRV